MLIIIIGIVIGILVILAIINIWPSIRVIGPTEVGLVRNRFGSALSPDNPVAFNNEAGYQAELLMPGWRFKWWVRHSVEKHPWPQIPANEIGVVYAQVGQSLPQGAKSAIYQENLGMFEDMRKFVDNGGQKGIQRPVLPPGTLAPYHPVGFLVITRTRVYGRVVSPELADIDELTSEAFGIDPQKLNVTIIKPERPEDLSQKFLDLVDSRIAREKSIVDTVGIITTLEGEPLPAGDIASRLGGFADIAKLEKEERERAKESGEGKEDVEANDAVLIEAIVGTKNELHNNYQNYQGFLDNGGKIGLQHDPLLYGGYTLNPVLISVEKVPMLVVEQGEVAVVKAYIGQVTEDTSGAEFKYGQLVRPGHKGIWDEPLRTGKYTVNPRLYQAEIVPTAIVTLNWADAVSEAHGLDKRLSSITAKSKEGFEFKIDLQVLIHIADTKASRVISMVGTVQNLVNEVLQSAVGNYFRDKIQGMRAIQFIEQRKDVQGEAETYIKEKLSEYSVETLGVYIQDVVFPDALVRVLNDREIANQLKATYQRQKEAQEERIKMEKEKGTADKQSELASATVDVTIKEQLAKARKNEAEGEAAYIRMTGEAMGAKEKSIGVGKAEGYKAQVEALSSEGTTLVNVAQVLAENGIKIVPDVMVSGGGNSLDGIAAVLMKNFNISSDKVGAVKKIITDTAKENGDLNTDKIEEKISELKDEEVESDKEDSDTESD